MFHVYHYYHWSNGHAIVVATSQVLGGGYTAETADEAARCFVPVGSRASREEAIAEARSIAAAIGGTFEEYQARTPTLDGAPILFAMKGE